MGNAAAPRSRRRSPAAPEMMDSDLSAYGCLEPVYADGIAGVVNLGANVMLCYFRWLPNSNGILERTPAVVMVRPMASMLGTEAVRQLVKTGPSVPAEIRH